MVADLARADYGSPTERLDEVVDLVKDFDKGEGWGKTEPEFIIGTILYGILGFLGVIALILIIGGGVVWMTAGGSEEKVMTARNVIKWAAIGMILILASYALTSFVVEEVLNSTQGTGGLTPTPVVDTCGCDNCGACLSETACNSQNDGSGSCCWWSYDVCY